MDIRNSRQSILPERQVAPLCRRSDARGLAQLAGHLALLAATGGLIYIAGDSGWRWPAMLLHGVVLVGLFAGLHECVHRTAFRRRRLNDLTASVIGWLLFLPAGFFRRFHFAHHRFTQIPGQDPELATAKPTRLAAYLFYLTAFFYWRDRLRELPRHAAGRVDAGFIPARERAAVAREARVHLLLYAGVAALMLTGVTLAPLSYWLLPLLLGQPFLRAYLLAEHTGCPETDDMLANTRTTLAGRMVRRLMWNMPYHTEHHVFPAVPFHALPTLHRAMAERLVVGENSYPSFHRRYVQALRQGRGVAFVHPLPAT